MNQLATLFTLSVLVLWPLRGEDVADSRKKILDELSDQRKQLTEKKTTPVNAERFMQSVLRNQLPIFAEAILEDPIRRAGIAAIENSRNDKQVGSTASSAGTTSLVSKGAASRLLGVAVENGAIKRAVDGTTVTLSTTPLSLYDAFQAQKICPTCPSLPPGGREKRLAGAFSLAVSFDTSRGASSGSFAGNGAQFSGLVGRYELVNMRDPRDERLQGSWNKVAQSQVAKLYAQNSTDLANAIEPIPDFERWRDETARLLLASPQPEVDLDFQLVKLSAIAQRQSSRLGVLAQSFSDARRAFVKTYDDQLTNIKNSLLLTLEYKYIRQSNIDISATQAASKMPLLDSEGNVLKQLPDLSSINLIYQQKLGNKVDATANAGFTFFHNLPPTLRIDPFRDFTAAGQFDFSLGTLDPFGKFVLSLAGMVIDLHQAPFGAKPKFGLTDKVFSQKGAQGVFQAKLTIPGANGIKIPLAFTYASKSDLLPDKAEKRANIGIQWDFDALFAKK